MDFFMHLVLFGISSTAAILISVTVYKYCVSSLDKLNVKYAVSTFTTAFNTVMLVGLAGLVMVLSSGNKKKVKV